MPTLDELRDQIARRHDAEHRAAQSDTRRDYVRTALACWGWCLVGLGLVGLSFHVTDMTIAEVAFWSGLGIGNAGMIFTLLGAYRRGEARGDW